MTILVTGGLGVNGAWVTRKLVERGLRVIVADRQSDRSLLGSIGNDVELRQVDIADPEAVGDLFRGRTIECVIHMAASVNVADDPLSAFRTNAFASVLLMDSALRAGTKRFVYTSSRAVYGNIEGEHAYPTYRPVTEDFPTRPNNVYDVTKLSAEHMGRVYAKRGLEFLALRFATIFGPGKLVRHGSTAIYSRLIENALAGVPLRIERGGDERDDVIYVDDVAESCVVAATHPKPSHHAYNISRGIGTTLGEFAAEVKRVVPGADLWAGPGLNYFGGDLRYASILDNTRAREDLGFLPRFDLAAGIRDYIARMREFGLQPVVS